jgi:hypothetical protein
MAWYLLKHRGNFTFTFYLTQKKISETENISGDFWAGAK